MHQGNMSVLIGWLMDRRSHSFLNWYYSGLLEPILDLSLDWCKLITFDGSCSGWLAETYCGLSKISLWFWLGLLCVSQDPEYQPPSTPYQRWTGKECKDWLRSQNIDVSKLNVSQAKTEVAKLMVQEGAPVGYLPQWEVLSTM